jgi:hypothetical protein
VESLIIRFRPQSRVRAGHRTFFAILLSALLFAGCTPPPKPLYYWGEYEDLLYSMYLNTGEADTTTQVAKLTEDMQKTRDNGQQVPPGVHAHLGYMHYLLGNAGPALAEFETEKQLYPESTVFMDRLIKQLTK